MLYNTHQYQYYKHDTVSHFVILVSSTHKREHTQAIPCTNLHIQTYEQRLIPRKHILFLYKLYSCPSNPIYLPACSNIHTHTDTHAHSIVFIHFMHSDHRIEVLRNKIINNDRQMKATKKIKKVNYLLISNLMKKTACIIETRDTFLKWQLKIRERERERAKCNCKSTIVRWTNERTKEIDVTEQRWWEIIYR